MLKASDNMTVKYDINCHITSEKFWDCRSGWSLRCCRATRGHVDMNDKTKTKKLCAICGQEIAPARLEALPGVTTCIACAKKHPRRIDTSGIELSEASPI